jgi:SAM-dependent methyltransferase
MVSTGAVQQVRDWRIGCAEGEGSVSSTPRGRPVGVARGRILTYWRALVSMTASIDRIPSAGADGKSWEASITDPRAAGSRWISQQEPYAELTTDAARDSEYIRRMGLIPNIIDLVGPVRTKRVLDAGCGTGWLFEELPSGEAWQCDLAPPPNRPGVRSSREDITGMSYPSDKFDVVVSSLVLMWVSGLSAALREMYRITKPGGRLVVALVHPYFAHAGRVVDEGFVVNRDLSTEQEIHDYFISGAVGPLTYYQRRPETYYNEALIAGWRLTRFLDWFVDMDHYERFAGDRRTATRRTGWVPTFTFFVGEKHAN